MKYNLIVGTSLVFLIGFLVLTFLASAFVFPPVVSISASPNPAGMTSTIVAVAVDLSGYGIEWVKIYEDGALVQECPVSTCVYVAVNPSPATKSYYAVTSDNHGGGATSSTINVEFQNTAPVLNSIGDKNVNEGSNLTFTISAYDYNNNTLSYSASGLPTGATFNSSTQVFSWIPDYSQFGIYYVTFSVSDGSLSDSETVAINVSNDVDAPKWSNLNVSPASANYSP